MRLATVIFSCVFSALFSNTATDKCDRYAIPCHSTDFDCFKRQYRCLRDYMLRGNSCLGIPKYEPYHFKYGPKSCVKLDGLQHSKLLGISLNSTTRLMSLSIASPFKIHQIRANSSSKTCELSHFVPDSLPEKEPYHKFTGEALIDATFPFNLERRTKDFYLLLKPEDLDVLVDIPDLSNYDKNSQLEKDLYESSEWAYRVVNKLDAAQYFVAPYTSQYRRVFERTPMKKYFLLYPEEKYVTLYINHTSDEGLWSTN